ncbi:MAG: bifunctional riboflavin kinase/FAD synthetase [Alphaproteobacteria bacterium]|nr:bifunctional riboflavin kinase/FAD synthetase [Alphaproteobacteria bacterium]
MDNSKQASVVAIGNFDGVHKGHAALLGYARKIADDAGLPLVVLTFEPHPRQFFKPDGAPFRLTPEKLKEARLKACGVDRVEILDFNAIMASLLAEMFIDMMLVDLLGAKHVVVGADFQFARNRSGTIETLKQDKRFETHAVTLTSFGDTPVSSTRIREALQQGDIEAANAMLGWEWVIEGEVIHGDKRGRELGYPTANIPFGDVFAPAYGIYAVEVNVGDGVWRKGAAAIGIRPMFEVKAPLLEVYLLDFEEDLYGRTLYVRPLSKLRNEEKFETLEALKAQMAKDVAQVRALSV